MGKKNKSKKDPNTSLSLTSNSAVTLDFGASSPSSQKVTAISQIPYFIDKDCPKTLIASINLAYNAITSLQSSEILNTSRYNLFQNLTTLNLAENVLTDIDGIGELKNIRKLNLSGNSLSNLPSLDELSCLTVLEEIRLCRNQFRGLDEFEKLCACKNLCKLTMKGNPCLELPHARPYVIASVPSLSDVDDKEVGAEERSEAQRRFERSIYSEVEKEVVAGAKGLRDTVHGSLLATDAVQIGTLATPEEAATKITKKTESIIMPPSSSPPVQPPPPPSRKMKHQNHSNSMFSQILLRVWNLADTNLDNEITKRELIFALRKNPEVAELFHLARRTRQEDGSRDKFELLFQEIDVDDSRTISWAEFYNYFKNREHDSMGKDDEETEVTSPQSKSEHGDVMKEIVKKIWHLVDPSEEQTGLTTMGELVYRLEQKPDLKTLFDFARKKAQEQNGGNAIDYYDHFFGSDKIKREKSINFEYFQKCFDSKIEYKTLESVGSDRRMRTVSEIGVYKPSTVELRKLMSKEKNDGALTGVDNSDYDYTFDRGNDVNESIELKAAELSIIDSERKKSNNSVSFDPDLKRSFTGAGIMSKATESLIEIAAEGGDAGEPKEGSLSESLASETNFFNEEATNDDGDDDEDDDDDGHDALNKSYEHTFRLAREREDALVRRCEKLEEDLRFEKGERFEISKEMRKLREEIKQFELNNTSIDYDYKSAASELEFTKKKERDDERELLRESRHLIDKVTGSGLDATASTTATAETGASSAAGTTATKTTKKEKTAAFIAHELHKSLAKNNVIDRFDEATARACVDAALKTLKKFSELTNYTDPENKTKEDEERDLIKHRLRAMNHDLNEEHQLLISCRREIGHFNEMKHKLQDSLLSLEKQVNTAKIQLQAERDLGYSTKQALGQEVSKYREAREEAKREMELLEKQKESEKQTIRMLRKDVDGENTHLTSLRRICESEFEALQQNVSDLGKKALHVQEDVNLKKKEQESLSEVIRSLRQTKASMIRECELEKERSQVEIGKARNSILMHEEALVHAKEDLLRARERGEETMGLLEDDVKKWERKVEEVKKDYKSQKQIVEEKKRRWKRELEDFKNEFLQQQNSIGKRREELADFRAKEEKLTLTLANLTTAVDAKRSEEKMLRLEIERMHDERVKVGDMLGEQVRSLESAIAQGKVVANKLRFEEGELNDLKEENDLLKKTNELLEVKKMEMEKKIKEMKMWEDEVIKLEERARKSKLEFEETSLMASKNEMEVSRLYDDKNKLALEMVKFSGEVEKMKGKLANAREMMKIEEVNNGNLKRENDILSRELDDLKSRVSIEKTEIEGYKDVRLTLKGLEGGTNEALAKSREELAKLNETKRILELQTEEISNRKQLKEEEFSRLNRLVENASTENRNLHKANMRLESDLRLSRKLENDIDLLQRSRDLASNEAMRAEEASLYAREQLRSLEQKILVVSNMKVRGEGSVEVGGLGLGLMGDADEPVVVSAGRDNIIKNEAATVLRDTSDPGGELLTTIGGDLNISAILEDEKNLDKKAKSQLKARKKQNAKRKTLLDTAINSVKSN